MDNNIKETEQWQLNGDCSKCRRQPFCTKNCGAKKRKDARKIRAVEDALYDHITHGLIPRAF